MAENQDAQEKTEQPTERRKTESRKKGQVPRSRELNTMLSLLSAALGLLMFGAGIASDFSAVVASALDINREVILDVSSGPARLMEVLVAGLMVFAPLFALMVLGAFAGPLLMGGWSFSPEALAFKLEKLSPLKGIKRVVSAKGLMELVKTLFKFFFLLAVAYWLITRFQQRILSLSMLTPVRAVAETAELLTWSLLTLASAMIGIVMFDVPFELWNHTRQLKMTKQEVKEEMKESEGRPEVKGRIRTLQREMAQRRMMDDVPTADVIITNPTHFAVALKYHDTPGAAPVIVAKGKDLVAQRIRTLAGEHSIAIFSAPPLARALYGSTEIGAEIPQNLYLAVARVLAYVYQVNSLGSLQDVAPPDDLDVPDEYRGYFDEGETNV